MLIVTMNQYFRQGLEELCCEPEKDSHSESVIFIPERSGEIYIYTRSNGENDLLMLFLSVLSSWRIVKDSKNKGAWGILDMSPGLYVNKKQQLSPREREILGALLQGASYKTTAEKFRITEKTVSLHKERAVRKLGVRNFHHLYLTYRYWQRCLRLQSYLSPSGSVALSVCSGNMRFSFMM